MLNIIISEKFYKLLNSKHLEHDFITHLLQSEIKDTNSYVEIEDEDTVSFISETKMKLLFKEQKNLENGFKKFEEFYFSRNKELWTKNRSTIKIGKYVNKILKNKKNTELIERKLRNFIRKTGHEELHMDRYVELFVNKFKALVKELSDPNLYNRIEIVSGEDIRKWYLEDNYLENKGTLGNSCMRHSSCQSYLDIYVDNPEICKLLIMKSEEDNNFIITRALLWKISDGNTYLDRIYSINEPDSIILMNYAEENNWLYYDNDYMGSIPMDIKVSKTYEEYPYMDTFKFLDIKGGIVYNTYEVGTYNLEEQDGTIEKASMDY